VKDNALVTIIYLRNGSLVAIIITHFLIEIDYYCFYIVPFTI